MKTLYYPGSFDPIGNHHLILAEIASEAGFDMVVFVPCFDAPHKDGLIEFKHRYEMCWRAVSYPGTRFIVSDIEEGLFKKNGRKSYTIETVRALKAAGEQDITLLTGVDSMRDLPKWHEPEELIDEATFVLAPRMRPDSEYGPLEPHYPQAILLDDPLTKHVRIHFGADLPMIDLSSTLIRERRKKGLSIRHLVPPTVLEYIEQQKLYLE